MDKELVKKWVAALRSGEYKQGKNQLVKLSVASEPEFCCLGVLAAVACGSRDIFKVRTYADSECIVANPVLRGVANLGKLSPDQDGDLVQLSSTLMYMNDSQNKSFPEIADYIEKELLSDDTTGA